MNYAGMAAGINPNGAAPAGNPNGKLHLSVVAASNLFPVLFRKEGLLFQKSPAGIFVDLYAVVRRLIS